METTLLIDGDVIAFVAAAAVQKHEEDPFGYVRPFASVVEGECAVDNILLGLIAGLGATHIRVVLSDPESNWRHEIDPTYKTNRTDSVRPLLLGRLKDHLRSTYGAFHWAGLEADDTLGILATEPAPYEGKRIVVGKDKDFKSIPGLHHRYGDRDHRGKFKVVEVTRPEADRFHMIQALSGDRTDGYYGCPGIGMERAERIIDEPVILTPARGVITRGKNKGQETTKWVSEPTTDLWECIVSHYRKAGLSEKEALITARLARILRAEDYDREKERIILWTPARLHSAS
jgi:5'-3' exonuclease